MIESCRAHKMVFSCQNVIRISLSFFRREGIIIRLSWLVFSARRKRTIKNHTYTLLTSHDNVPRIKLNERGAQKWVIDLILVSFENGNGNAVLLVPCIINFQPSIPPLGKSVLTYDVQLDMMVDGWWLPEIHSTRISSSVKSLHAGHTQHRRFRRNSEMRAIAKRWRLAPQIRPVSGSNIRHFPGVITENIASLFTFSPR